MSALLTPVNDPLHSPVGLAVFLVRRVAVAVIVGLVATAAVLVGIDSGDLGGTVSLEHHDAVAEEPHDAG